jgi:hypothetical protein
VIESWQPYYAVICPAMMPWVVKVWAEAQQVGMPVSVLLASSPAEETERRAGKRSGLAEDKTTDSGFKRR